MPAGEEHKNPPRSKGRLVMPVVAALRARSIDPAGPLRSAGLAGIDPNARSLSLPAGAEFKLIECAAEAALDSAFGLHLAESVDLRGPGLYFYLIGAASSVREAISLSVRHVHLANQSMDPILSFEPNGGATIENRYGGFERRNLKHSIEFTFAFMTRLLRTVAGSRFKLDTLCFEHERTTGHDEFQRYFNCPVTFGANSDRVTFSNETLELPLVSGDPALLAVLEPLANAETAAGEDSSLRADVEIELRRLLPNGNSKIEAVAGSLGVSIRSLSRRLASENTTFSELLDDLRRTLAIKYLAEKELSVSQIAFMVGYDNYGSFSNAFRRWTGTTPSEARASGRAAGELA
jgi:AraC-like DNA-binding protein